MTKEIMNKVRIDWLMAFIVLGMVVSCNEFLVRTPLDTPSSETFWETADQAEMWVNSLYNGLPTGNDAIFEAYSDNAFGRAGLAANNIANGSFEPNDIRVNENWNYRYIRAGLEFFQNIDRVPDITPARLDQLSGQVHFHLAFQYYRLITLYRDVPLVMEPLNVDRSDVPKSPKAEVLAYILDQVDQAVAKLPETWPPDQAGRATRGAALALKARVLLFNERWQEAANAAKQIMDAGNYKLHPNFDEIFRLDFNNRTEEVILAYQLEGKVAPVPAENAAQRFLPVSMGCCALVLPTPQLEASFEMSDGLPIDESPLFDATRPFDNRDPRYYETFLYHGAELDGVVLDLTTNELNFARTYLYYKKYIQGRDNLTNNLVPVNWIIFRYADVLLMYAEAQNESAGPDDSVYDALDLIRERAGMPLVDRSRYSDQSSLREFIRNERRVELAGEGLRYFDIIRWRTAEHTMNITLKSMDLANWVDGPVDPNGNPILTEKAVQPRTFDPARHYVWPIPQDAIDRSDGILVQHEEW